MLARSSILGYEKREVSKRRRTRLIVFVSLGVSCIIALALLGPYTYSCLERSFILNEWRTYSPAADSSSTVLAVNAGTPVPTGRSQIVVRLLPNVAALSIRPRGGWSFPAGYIFLRSLVSQSGQRRLCYAFAWATATNSGVSIKFSAFSIPDTARPEPSSINYSNAIVVSIPKEAKCVVMSGYPVDRQQFAFSYTIASKHYTILGCLRNDGSIKLSQGSTTRSDKAVE
jgi:hypothetical protein